MRHTAATWALVHDRKTTFEVAGIIGATEAMVSLVYGHHMLDIRQAEAVRRMAA